MKADVRSTYRLQLHPDFDFADAGALAGYLAELGVSHLYASPYLQAAPGSTHGYDVVDHRRVSAELGGEKGHAALVESLEEEGLGQVLDIVPNHMAVSGTENPWWWDVLENGAASRYADYFDVDWEHGTTAEGEGEGESGDAILLPVLDTHYGRVLDAGRILIHRDGGSFSVRFEDHAFPAGPRSLGGLLARAAELVPSGGGREEGDQSPDPDATGVGRVRAELSYLGDALSGLPFARTPDRALGERRDRDRTVLLRHLGRLLRDEPVAAAAVDRVIEDWNGDPGALDAFLDEQAYRLAFWRMAQAELGYRRFFHINELVALRAEDERVFRDTHRKILEWLRRGILDGVRVDHPDGLRDPEGYFRRLRDEAPDAWVVAEKILEPEEELRDSWEVEGTTGYDFLNRVGGLLVDPEGETALTDLFTDFTGESADYPALVRARKHMAFERLLGSDLNRLTELFRRVCQRHPRHRDYTRRELRAALAEVAACFPVYRSYVRAAEGTVDPADVRRIEKALEAAAAHRPDLSPDPLDFLRDLLLLRVTGAEETELVMRFQQLTGPVAAKGVEDTAFYQYNRLISLNEVGGDPGRFGVTVEAFHRESARIQERWPRTLLTTSTHDTKRSEDVRARLHLLSEIPELWSQTVRRWAGMNERHRIAPSGPGDEGEKPLPDRNAEYMLYQALVGVWPIGEDRLLAFLEKAVREAKVHTSWTDPNPEYEEALATFARAVLGDAEFVEEVEAFVGPLVAPGRMNSLAQTLIRLISPGVPDLYQGCELWDLSLVDPDNRRPVDFRLRRDLLAEVSRTPPPTPEALLERSDEALPKLHLIRSGLALRTERPRTFGPEGGYRPLWAKGTGAGHVVAFARGEDVVAVAPRLPLRLGGEWLDGGRWRGRWGDTTLELPAGEWEDRLTGERHGAGGVELSRLLTRFPVALLARTHT